PGSPAEAAGLQPNDRITAVDGQSVADLSINEAVSLIRGPKGSSVELTVLRGQEEFTVQINRDSIPVQSVFHSIHPEKANT
ncbi:peptidase S41, partial [Salmonella enterica subsp. enterica serovar Typhimurium]|uniref:S41 family peptidase n=1 Tax=Salmonella enterica TaxID=28901 RepID=UPI000CBC2221